MKTLEGVWFYQSYCPLAGVGTTPPQLAAPWSPPGQMTVTTDRETGQVTGTLQFAPKVVLTIRGVITPAADNLPEGVELTGEGLGSISRLRGFFIAGANVVVGTTLAAQNDLAKRPDGTMGPFVLYPSDAR